MSHRVSKLLAVSILLGTLAAPNTLGNEIVQLIITGGHETDPIDRGRPVVLIAKALGVKPEVFRTAFSRVTPAPRGTTPKADQVRQNKEALLLGLSPFGVTNELLDQVSDYYRYRPERGNLWPTRPAVAYATLSGPIVKSITVANSGSGYSSLPTITVPGHPEIRLEAKIAFSRDLKTNGCISSISLLPK